MAYGRLEVYWADGRLETHFLDTETVSIGRAEGNTIALDTDAISRYHMSITKDGDNITLTDLGSQNGTYADGVRLESNKPHLLGDVEEIQVGSLRILFRKVDESPTMAIPVQDESTQRIERDKSNIRLDLDHARLNVWPAASGSAELAVLNTGDKTQRLSLRVSGMPNEWLRLTRSEIELDAGETVYVLLNIKPPRRPNTVPTRYDVMIEVAPVTQPELVVHALLEVNVQAYSGFGIAIVPQIDPGDPISAFLHNQGSSNLRLSLSAIDKNHILNFKLPDTVLTLQPGQRLRVDVEVSANNPPLMGAPQEHHFVIQAKSHDESGFVAATGGIVQIPPRLPLWGVLTAVGIGLSVLALAIVAIFGLLNSTEPTINSVSVNTEELAQGDDLILLLDADNVDTFDVLVNNIVVLSSLPGDSEQVAIDTDELQGALDIAVIGRSPRGDIEASTSAFIYVPMHVASFTAQPDTLVRNVVGTLTIAWDVPGAAIVRISGLTEFTNRLLQSSTEYEATHTLNGISGIPADTLDIVLYAEDEVGNALEETLRIPVIDPQCTATTDIVLYEGPNERFQQVGSIAANTTVIVTAQDAEADWLRVQLPGNVRGWGQDDSFDCDDSFNVADLRTEMNLPELPTTAPLSTVAPTQGTSNPPASPTIAPTPQLGG
jgi:pSer/pThr/pTyr-binding forkhead associated (FHA) protein